MSNVKQPSTIVLDNEYFRLEVRSDFLYDLKGICGVHPFDLLGQILTKEFHAQGNIDIPNYVP